MALPLALAAFAAPAAFGIARRFLSRRAVQVGAGVTAGAIGGGALPRSLAEIQARPRRRRRRLLTAQDKVDVMFVASAISKKAAENLILVRRSH